MANIKSAKKRVLVNRKKAERNKSIKSAVKTSIKKVEVAIEQKIKKQQLQHYRTQFLLLIKQLLKVFITKIQLQEKFPLI